VPRVLDEAVAITAIHAELTHMKTVIKMNRLGRLITDPSGLGGRVIRDPGDHCDTKNAKTDRNFERREVDPTGKKVCHRWERFRSL
jgi:streptomycin 6-kinase